jgi:membrane protease YdiL (CAAX protease family)
MEMMMPTTRSELTGSVDTRRLWIFLAFAFGIAWLVGLVIALTGGLINSPRLSPASRATLAGVLLPTGYMWAPALANIFTRAITREGWTGVWLRPHFRRGWPYWLITWVVPAVLVVLGMILFFAVLPQYYDPALTRVRQLLGAAGATMSPLGFVAAQAVQAVVISPIVNSPFTFGEEFGWRAYLLPKLMPLGWRRASLLLGLIWGVWHWPVIAMGYEYGLRYPGFPWVGFLLFWWFTVPVAIFLAWATLRSKSVWPAVIGHGAINGIAALPVLFIQGQPSPLLGPVPIGLIGGLPFVLLGLWLWLRPGPVEERLLAEPQME